MPLMQRIKYKLRSIFYRLIFNKAFRQSTSGWRKLPDFIIIGAQKGGTSSLFYYLQQHPELSLPSIKELHYYDKQYDRGLQWYKSFFPLRFRQKITGEASPYYIFHPHVPQRLKKDNPKVRLIVLLRDPIERAYSHYKMEQRKGKDDFPTFKEAIKQEAERTEQETFKLISDSNYYSFAHQTYTYLARGRYYKQLQRWLRHFDHEQFLFIKSENFFQNPQATLKRVYHFLDVDEIYPKDLTPRNVGNYEDATIGDDVRAFCYNALHEDEDQLIKLLGEEFRWLSKPAFIS